GALRFRAGLPAWRAAQERRNRRLSRPSAPAPDPRRIAMEPCNRVRAAWARHATPATGRVSGTRNENVQYRTQGTAMGRRDADPGNGQDGPPGRRRGRRDARRDDGAGHRRLREEAEGGVGFLPADGSLPGEVLRRRKDPGRLLQARGAADREGG